MKKLFATAVAGLISMSAFAADPATPAATPNPTQPTQSAVKPTPAMKTTREKHDKDSTKMHDSDSKMKKPNAMSPKSSPSDANANMTK